MEGWRKGGCTCLPLCGRTGTSGPALRSFDTVNAVLIDGATPKQSVPIQDATLPFDVAVR